jgi:hypothetical protein
MTCNVARPHAGQRRETVATFSPVRPDMLFAEGDAIELFAFPRARPVRAPTIMGGCLCDTASPATTVYAAYRSLPDIPKRLCWSPGTDHDLLVAFERRARRWPRPTDGVVA